MLKSILNLVIVLSFLLTPCFHAVDTDGTANRDGLIAIVMASDSSDEPIDQGKMLQPGHHCWCEHSSFTNFETPQNDIDNRRGAPFVAHDAMKASAVVAPLLEPPSV